MKELHERGLAEGFGEVYLPFALARKYPKAGRSWPWQYVFPAGSRSVDPLDGVADTTSAPSQKLLGRKDVSTTMICTHVLNRGGRGVRSPLDRLDQARERLE